MTAAPPKNIRKNESSNATSTALIKRLLHGYVLPYKFDIIIAMFFMIISGGMTALIAALMQPVLDDVLYGQKKELIVPVCAAIAVAFAGRGITTYIHTLIMNRIGHSIVADIQTKSFEHFLSMDMAFFHRNPSGHLLSRIVNDVNVLRGAVTNCMTGMGKSVFTLVFLIGLMFYRDWKLTLAAFIVFPLISLFVIYIGKRLRSISKSIQREMGGLSDILSQTFTGIRLVKAYGMEESENVKAKATIHDVRDLNIKSVKVATLSTPVNDTIVGMIFAAIIAYGGYSVIAGTTSAGQLASFIAAFSLAYEPMKKLAKLNNSLQLGLGAAERVFEVMDEKPEINDAKDAHPLLLEHAEITFDSVDFTYEGSELKALNGVSFTAPKGKVTALVGPSGGGKSTIINLIPRFYDVSGGSIMIDNQGLREVTQKSLRSHIALVSQDIMIFNASVWENIRYGRPEASDEEVQDAARKAAAHDFIVGLEQGYDTILGESGVKISGGQKQRISIARAILRDAPILLLDEATSALDNESEKLVQEALAELQKGRTTLVIAHRLTTVQGADNILVLQNGQIVEQGTHDTLMKNKSLYESMYNTGMRE